MAILVDCPHCGETLHVKDEFAGRTGKCPKCLEKFRVPERTAAAAGTSAAATFPAATSATRTVPSSGAQDGEAVLAASAAHLFAKLPADRDQLHAQILSAFSGPLTPPRVSLVRKLGIVIVAVVLSILPLFYVAALGGLAYGLVWLATSGFGQQLAPAVYWVTIIAGGVVLVCLLKPLVEPRRRLVEAFPLAPDKERLLTDFVAKICEQIGASPPELMQLECSTRLAAEYRRGLAGLLARDVVLTIGLPLAACLSVEQLAALVTVQMAQYRRHAGCRATNYIRAINGWLWRSVYEDGRFDAWLARVAARPHFHLAKLLVPLRAAKLVAQAVLFIPMFIGNTVAAGLVRLTELDADRCSARLVGRETFAATLVRLSVVDFTWQGVLAELDFLYREQQLPDSLPQQLALRMLDMTPELCAALRDTVVKQEEKPFDSRPSDEERLAATKAEPAVGVLKCPLPARALLADYEGVAQRMTFDYYVALFGPRQLKESLTRVELPTSVAGQ